MTSTSSPITKRARGQDQMVHNIGSGSPAVTQLLTLVRDRTSSQQVYCNAMDRLAARLADEAFARLSTVKGCVVDTPTMSTYTGLTRSVPESVVLVSILRSGDILLEACRQVVPGCEAGKILIQRDELSVDKRPILFWKKLPVSLKNKDVIVCDPMLGTGGTVLCCLDELIKLDADPSRIVFVNVVSCPEGLKALAEKFPTVQVITAAIDTGLNKIKYIVPGLGDAGDRYYGVG